MTQPPTKGGGIGQGRRRWYRAVGAVRSLAAMIGARLTRPSAYTGCPRAKEGRFVSDHSGIPVLHYALARITPTNPIQST
jgi:hypothetical protein